MRDEFQPGLERFMSVTISRGQGQNVPKSKRTSVVQPSNFVWWRGCVKRWYFLKGYSYKALQPAQGSGLFNYFLPSISVLCYILPVAYIHALYIFQDVFPSVFRSSSWSFRHGFPSLNLLHIVIFRHAFNMAQPVQSLFFWWTQLYFVLLVCRFLD